MDKFEKIINSLDNTEFSFDQDLIKTHCLDWRKEFEGTSELIVFPNSLKKISKVVSICSDLGIPIIPQGGNTSLVGGSVPRKKKNEIILNLKNFNQIRSLSELDSSIIVEAGCILESIHNFLNTKGFTFPVSMGSRGSCQIGGNIATNAGGINVIKYGSLRSNIIGIEAVLDNGDIFSDLKNIKKDNTGYDLKQLLIGSEGTLGIITAANFMLYPTFSESKVIFASFKNLMKLIEFYQIIKNLFSSSISSFELINNESMQIVLENYPQNRQLFDKTEYYCLVEICNFNNIENFSSYVSNNLEKGLKYSNEIIISKSDHENIKLWEYRELIPLAETKIGYGIKHDISIPLESMNSFITKTMDEITRIEKQIRLVNFGHVGDNNLHFNIMHKNKLEAHKLKKNKLKFNKIIYDNVSFFGGSFSAEHGIGQLKKKELRSYKSKIEFSKMKEIKKNFDPKNIFNPGKVF